MNYKTTGLADQDIINIYVHGATAFGVDQAERYHAVQIGLFAETDADMVTAYTITNAPEAIGVTRAAPDASTG